MKNRFHQEYMIKMNLYVPRSTALNYIKCKLFKIQETENAYFQTLLK